MDMEIRLPHVRLPVLREMTAIWEQEGEIPTLDRVRYHLYTWNRGLKKFSYKGIYN